MKLQIKNILLTSLIIAIGTLVITALVFGPYFVSDAESLLKTFIVMNIISIFYHYRKNKDRILVSSILTILMSLILVFVLGLITFMLLLRLNGGLF